MLNQWVNVIDGGCHDSLDRCWNSYKNNSDMDLLKFGLLRYMRPLVFEQTMDIFMKQCLQEPVAQDVFTRAFDSQETAAEDNKDHPHIETPVEYPIAPSDMTDRSTATESYAGKNPVVQLISHASGYKIVGDAKNILDGIKVKTLYDSFIYEIK